MPKLPTLRAITQGERELREWHRNLRIGAAAAGYGMMLASLYQLHWAGSLIGFPSFAAAAMAGALEVLLAFNAGAVTSIRKRNPDGTEGGYYWSLWCIFAFLLCISIAANVGHAMIALSEWFSKGGAPSVMVEHKVAVYAIGSAVAAMVPLGGSFGLHVSGFVRAHGAGSDWVDADGTGALLDATAPAPVPQPGPPAERRAMEIPAQSPPGRAPEAEKPEPESGKAEGSEETERTAEDTLTLKAVVVVSEEELYAEYRAARDAGETERFGRRGDLNPSQLGRRLGQTPQNGRKHVGPRFEARYRAEKLAASSEEGTLDALAAGKEMAQAS
ncbi:hypothetical protein QR97_02245 [Streptomyces sp. PBH53]|uniref:hypothetical protein n=1 Tax=Streptomyces sp. PBH53 TaxID=1577075 RepID=UPI0006556C60|nr:hypothetical protein [Streptomyces sp. PBH53]AKN68778.1 hypothetical protein QR97_02245 [Streptomyces sp. PBH53]